MKYNNLLYLAILTCSLILPSQATENEQKEEPHNQQVLNQAPVADFGYYINAEDTDDLTNNAAIALRKSYNGMRKKADFNEFVKLSKNFYKIITDPVINTKIGFEDQTEYIKEATNLRIKLITSHPLLSKIFENYQTKLRHRIFLAHIDQQIFKKEALIGEDIARNNSLVPLRYLVGRIFHIIQKKDEPETVSDVGSGIFASYNNYSLQNIEKNTVLNRVFTCAHVIASYEDEHSGVYFVPDYFLDHTTGFPNLNLKDEVELINYLKTAKESFQISTYSIGRRADFYTIISHNNMVETTNPQYWKSEDIVLGDIKLKDNQNFVTYPDEKNINFDIVRNGNTPNFGDTQRYYAFGYPVLPHYQREPFKKHRHFELIKKLGYSPLVMTSNIAHDQDTQNENKKRPLFKSGSVKHEVPVSSGMSGGPLVMFKDNKIYFLGCNSRSLVDENGIMSSESCY